MRNFNKSLGEIKDCFVNLSFIVIILKDVLCCYEELSFTRSNWPKPMLEGGKNAISLKVTGHVGDNNMFQKFATYTCRLETQVYNFQADVGCLS